MKTVVPEEREFKCSNTNLNQSFGNFVNFRTTRLPMPGGWSNCSQKKITAFTRVLIETLLQDVKPVVTLK